MKGLNITKRCKTNLSSNYSLISCFFLWLCPLIYKSSRLRITVLVRAKRQYWKQQKYWNVTKVTYTLQDYISWVLHMKLKGLSQEWHKHHNTHELNEEQHRCQKWPDRPQGNIETNCCCYEGSSCDRNQCRVLLIIVLNSTVPLEIQYAIKGNR